MRLLSLKFAAKSTGGWTSGERAFGEFLTLIYGPNGSGKTPLIKGILFALGYPLQIPPDIVAHCSTVELAVAADQRYRLVKPLEEVSSISVVPAHGTRLELPNELRATEWLFGRWNAAQRTVTGKNDQDCKLYLGVLGPAFWVDQDLGWRSTYCPLRTKNWIREQEQEIVRFLLGVPPRHPFRSREDLDEKNREIATLGESIETKRRALGDALARDLDSEIHAAEQRKAQLLTRFGEAESGIQLIKADMGGLDQSTQGLEGSLQEVRARVDRLENQRRRYTKVGREMEAEADILSANATAAEELRRFCDNKACGLFKDAEASFGRSLLFLRDQIKDLTSASSDIAREITALREQAAGLERRVDEARVARRRQLSESGHGSIVTTIEALTRELAHVDRELANARQLATERQSFEAMVNRHVQAQAEAASLRATGARVSKTEVDDARRMLQERIETWISILNTQNVRRPITIDENFGLILGDRKFGEESPESGSTRTRIVLAYHAAVLETALARGSTNHPGWLVLDAPRQHELREDDLRAYVRKLREISAAHPGKVQVVLATSDLVIAPEQGDAVWEPQFNSPEGPRFFGPPPSQGG